MAHFVTIFGSSAPVPGSAEYRQAEELGQKLAENGFNIVNGGYFGTMEATSKGASTVEGCVIEGVICTPTFPHRAKGNEYLRVSTDSSDLLGRIGTLTARSNNFVVLPGTVGTLTELAVIWNLKSIKKYGLGEGRNPDDVKILCYRKPWEKIITMMGEELGICREHLDMIIFVDDADHVVQILKQ